MLSSSQPRGAAFFTRRFVLLAALTLAAFSLANHAQAATDDKPAGDAQKQFNIVQYGAAATADDVTKIAPNTQAIQKAIDACAAAGGGRVVVPAGTFLTGTIVLKSNVNLHLEKGAVLLGSTTVNDYPFHKPANRRRYDLHLGRSLVLAQGADRVSVTGEGTINGNSKAKNDFYDARLRANGDRPTALWFDECTNVTVKGITMTSAGFWTNPYSLCRNVHIDGIRITESTFMNNDGCDICDCENVLIENCDIDCLDDAVCLKGFMPGGCKNIVVRNNRLRSLCNAIKTGTDSSGGFQNLLIEDNYVHQTGIAGIALEITDGGTMQNVVIRNTTMDVVGTPIFIKLGDRNRPLYDGEKKFPVANGALRGVRISGVRAIVDKIERRNDDERRMHNYACYASSITGFPGCPIEDVQIEDVDITIRGGFAPGTAADVARKVPENSTGYPENRMFGVLPAYGLFVRHAKDVTMKNVRIAIQQEDARPAVVLDDARDSVFADFQAKDLSGADVFLIRSNCRNVQRPQNETGRE
ncbi:MAG TPA: glycoside hydrolase family 28 protein [Thermoguttaceae bacterium]|nr:glycoside hydrolase family 28 protein [Thermoguttaceae bacterium]